MAPSPKYATATPPVVRWRASAAPVAAAMLPPTIPNEPISRSSGEVTFMEPARPPLIPVALLEDARHPGRDRLLPGVEVRRPVDLAGEEERLDEVLEAADEQHPPVEVLVQLEVVEDPGRRLVAD